jgi:hypothetical protein
MEMSTGNKKKEEADFRPILSIFSQKNVLLQRWAFFD